MDDRAYRVAIGFNLVLDPRQDPTGQRFEPGTVIPGDELPAGLDVEALLAQGVLRPTTDAAPRRRRRPLTPPTTLAGDGGDA
jgi:hypothetical protein